MIRRSPYRHQRASPSQFRFDTRGWLPYYLAYQRRAPYQAERPQRTVPVLVRQPLSAGRLFISLQPIASPTAAQPTSSAAASSTAPVAQFDSLVARNSLESSDQQLRSTAQTGLLWKIGSAAAASDSSHDHGEVRAGRRGHSGRSIRVRSARTAEAEVVGRRHATDRPVSHARRTWSSRIRHAW